MRQDIYMHKGVPDDSTPLSAESPTTASSSESPSMTTGGKVALAYGALAARSATRTIMSEIRMSGNEQVANTVQTIAKGVTDIGLIVGTGGKVLIPMAISGGLEAISSFTERTRNNNEREIENRLRGANINFMQGVG